MVIKKLVFVAWACLVALGITACTFKERTFRGDLACESDADCDRPDQECRVGLCTQRGCSSANPCPAGHEFSCTAEGLCVAAECSGDTCSNGYACNEGFCQASFNVVSAASLSNTSISITFDSPPDAATATDVANYTVDGLALSGTPTLAGSTVTITTGAQTSTTYTVTVANVLRDFDKASLILTTAMFTGRGAFNVVSATSTSAISVAVTFSEPPDPTTALNIANYSIDNGLAVTNVPVPSLSGNVVTISTGTQAAGSYTVTVSNVVRAADAEALTSNMATFAGRTDFNVVSVASTSSTTITVTFDAPPSSAQATMLANYTVAGLTLSGTPQLSGSTVTITTAPQATQMYTVMVNNINVTRNADGEPLTVNSMDFTGRSPFNVSDALARTTRQFSVTFDAPPDPTAAMTLGNYSVNGLALTGSPTLAGNVVFIDTAANQAATTYTVTVSNVKRASDMEPLTVNSANFSGRAPFDVATASATSSSTITVTFSDAPNSGQAILAGNYMLSGNVSVLNVSAPSGNTLTLTTTPMAATNYTLTVSGVTRGSDGEALTVATAMFMGRAPFNVTGAMAATSSTITVTFDSPPNLTAAQTVGNYTIPGLALVSATLTGSVVTLTTSTAMSATTYTVTVTGVPRSSDTEPLTVNAASFTGRTKFNVESASSGSNVSVRVYFDAAPNSGQATTIGNYSATGGLILSNPVLSGNMVTLTTTTQGSGTNYTITVTGVTRTGDSEPLTVNNANFTGLTGFNVVGAAAVNTTTVTVTFDAPPTASAAGMASNYTISGGVTVMAASYVSGNVVTLTTSALSGPSHTVTVTGGAGGVTKGSDSSVLVVTQAAFTYTSFNVLSSAAITNKSASITFDAPPNATQAVVLANYSVNCSPSVCTNITLSNPVLNGNTVTFTTTAQQAGKTYTVTVANAVTRASDGALLANKVGSFIGRAAFNVTSAVSLTSGTISVTFDAAPNAAQATNLARYMLSGGLTLSGTPVLNGNTVTLNTSVQMAVSYTVTVTGVTRDADGEPLSTNMATFTGKAQSAPTVTNVQVQSTVPDNSLTFYNTGSATVVITGTEFNGVSCPNGVKLDDKDGIGSTVGTKPTSCTVNSATQITATFPPGIRSNYTGWNVLVTNSVNTNATSTVKLVVKAGLVVSEVYVGSSSGGDLREFLEIYNVTATSLNRDTLGLSIHVRTSAGAETIISPNFTGGSCASTCTKDIPSHKHWLLVSQQSNVTTTDPWWQYRDGIYDASASSSAAQLTTNSTVYIALSSTAQTKVIDKVGWGSTQDTDAGRETTRLANFGNDNKSVQRKPNTTNPDTDTDVNSTDFNASSTTISPKGTDE